MASSPLLLGNRGWVETLEQQLAHLPAGAHVCPLYDTVEEHFRGITPFLHAGIQRGELCLYVGDNSSPQDLVRRGIASTDDIRRGALVVLPERESYTDNGRFDPDSMLRRWDAWVADARAKGVYRGPHVWLGQLGAGGRHRFRRVHRVRGAAD